MVKASDNPYPSVLLNQQGSDPSTPAADLWRLYFKSGGLYHISDTGAVVGPLSTGGAGALQAAKYVRTSANYTTTSTSFVDVDATNMALTITTGARRVLVGLVGTISNSGTNTNMFEVDLDAGTKLSGGAGFGLMQIRTPVAGYRTNASFTYLTDALTAASHTFKLQWLTTAGTLTLYGTSAGDSVATFYVQEVY